MCQLVVAEKLDAATTDLQKFSLEENKIVPPSLHLSVLQLNPSDES
jgi:hypothetical protein